MYDVKQPTLKIQQIFYKHFSDVIGCHKIDFRQMAKNILLDFLIARFYGQLSLPTYAGFSGFGLIRNLFVYFTSIL